MKKNHRHFLTTILLITGFSLFAQDSSFKLGIKAGINFSSLSIDKDALPDKNLKLGPHLGVTTTYTFPNNIFLQSGLTITSKGTKIEGEAPIGLSESLLYPGREASLVSQQWYLQIPINFGYGIRVSPNSTIFVNAGPYIAWGIGGKTKLTGDIIYGDMIEYSSIENETFADAALEKFDAGVAAGIGVDIGKVIIGLNYELGLRDIGPEMNSYAPFYKNSSYKNRNASLSLEYRF